MFIQVVIYYTLYNLEITIVPLCNSIWILYNMQTHNSKFSANSRSLLKNHCEISLIFNFSLTPLLKLLQF